MTFDDPRWAEILDAFRADLRHRGIRPRELSVDDLERGPTSRWPLRPVRFAAPERKVLAR